MTDKFVKYEFDYFMNLLITYLTRIIINEVDLPTYRLETIRYQYNINRLIDITFIRLSISTSPIRIKFF